MSNPILSPQQYRKQVASDLKQMENKMVTVCPHRPGGVCLYTNPSGRMCASCSNNLIEENTMSKATTSLDRVAKLEDELKKLKAQLKEEHHQKSKGEPTLFGYTEKQWDWIVTQDIFYIKCGEDIEKLINVDFSVDRGVETTEDFYYGRDGARDIVDFDLPPGYWRPWFATEGSVCPMSKDTKVVAMLRSGDFCSGNAGGYVWKDYGRSSICMYQLLPTVVPQS